MPWPARRPQRSLGEGGERGTRGRRRTATGRMKARGRGGRGRGEHACRLEDLATNERKNARTRRWGGGGGGRLRRKQRRGALTNHNRHGPPEVREEDEQRVARLGRQLVVAPLELALLDHVRRQAPLAVRRLRELALLVRRHLRRHARALRRAVQQRLPAGGRAGGRRRGGREGVRDCGGRAEAPRQRRRRTPAAGRRRPHFALAPPAILDEGLKSASSTSVLREGSSRFAKSAAVEGRLRKKN